MLIQQTIIFILIVFAGYALGRIGHIAGGHIKSPHHWIYGLFLIIIGLVFFKDSLGFYIIASGFGLFISDLKDFFSLKFYGVDDVGRKRFWGID